MQSRWIWRWQLYGLIVGLMLGVGAGWSQEVRGQEAIWSVATWFNPAQPVKIRILNRTPHPLEYGLTDPRPIVTEVQAGQQVELTSVRIPNCLAVNTPMLSPVQYNVSVADNWIIVEVKVVSDVSGDHCLDLRANGAIYIY